MKHPYPSMPLTPSKALAQRRRPEVRPGRSLFRAAARQGQERSLLPGEHIDACDVIVLDHAGIGAWATLDALGFHTRHCTALPQLYRLAARHSQALLVLAAVPAIHVAVARLRTLAPEQGIVVLAAATDVEGRVRTLLCGADACLDKGTDARELAAVLLALHRRRPPEGAGLSAARPELGEPYGKLLASLANVTETAAITAGATGQWRLLDAGWTLESPGGARLALTTAERQLMLELLDVPGKEVTREHAMRALHGGRDNPQGGPDTRRYVDVIVSRLRRKAAAQGLELPIRTVRGSGYMMVNGES